MALKSVFAFQSAAAGLVLLLSASPAFSQAPQIDVPRGFQATLLADDDLAHDIYSMTCDAQGRVVVSGAGYVRILIDEDQDGKADRAQTYADGPRSGAQGMFFHGRDLICTGDGGLIRYRDRDGDDRADGPPQKLLSIRTGGEHHAHAVRLGPDGWWYLLAGNMAGVTAKDATSPHSPIQDPQSGVLMRLSPDFSQTEIITDGFRNAYDFAFHSLGDAFAYDSDGERDASLPWYRPTRVFQALPGASAGWFSRSWKRPDYFAETPPVIASLGRGSPTGVACYRHHAFPPPYQGAVFVADWTFGRVVAVPLTKNGSVFGGRPMPFMTGKGQFGFAPTDIAIGPRGALYVSVGGRGSRGGVYRVVWKEAADQEKERTTSKLDQCLRAAQPLSSWSRAKWVPLAKELGKDRLREAALDSQRPADQRVRAIEILTELFGGLDGETLSLLAGAREYKVRARAAWSAGRVQGPGFSPRLLTALAGDRHPLVARWALESLALLGPQATSQISGKLLAKALNHPDRFLHITAARLVKRMSLSSASWEKNLTNQGRIALALGQLERSRQVDVERFQLAQKVLASASSKSLQLEATRLAQLALGDVGPIPGGVAAFDGYRSRADATLQTEIPGELIETWLSHEPKGDRRAGREWLRVIAMLAAASSKALDCALAPIREDSHPTDDLHSLLVAARISGRRSSGQGLNIAGALVEIEYKIAQRDLRQDNNWEPRLRELYRQLVKHDSHLRSAVIGHPRFGLAGHVIFLDGASRQQRARAAEAFAKRIEQDERYEWSGDVIRLLAETGEEQCLNWIRAQYDHLGLRDDVLKVLAKSPEPRDRSKFITGLDSSQLDVLRTSADALAKLPASREADEQFALLSALRRLGREKKELPVREQIVRLLRRNLNQDFGFRFGSAGRGDQQIVVRKWTQHIESAYPQQAAQRRAAIGDEAKQLSGRLAQIDWSSGNVERGKTLFHRRACAQCHGGRRALGPDLAGAAKRFSRHDLFMAIVAPHRDVSPRYQTTYIATKDGRSFTGLIIYESVDGLTLRSGDNRTYRIEAEELLERRVLPNSLMPAGLLKTAPLTDWADLYAYLQSLSS